MNVTEYEVFTVFFAIFWSTVANVQPRWKAFQWPLFCRHRPARCRVILSVLLLNVAPVLLFAYVFWALGHDAASTPRPIWRLILHGILPAFGVFGCYRLWLATVEAWPATFYSAKVGEGGVDKKYRHVEPTYRTGAAASARSEPKLPIVYLGPDTACPNFMAAILYLILTFGSPWIPA